MIPATQEQQTALQILRTSSSIATAEQLAALIQNTSILKYCQLEADARLQWLCDQINALNYMTHSSRIESEIDLLVEASMIDQAIMDDNVRWLTQVEMQEAFRRGITKEYGDFFGITASSIVQFLRGFMTGEKRQRAKAIIREKEAKKEREANERLWAEIQEMKKKGLYVPSWGPNYDFKKKTSPQDSEAHKERIHQQREEILKHSEK